jgi:hypothetical protein
MSRGLDSSSRSPSVSMTFSSADRHYEPFDTLAVRYAVELPSAVSVHAIERSVLWYTEGKGEEDLGVWFFDRITERAAVAAAATGGTLETRLPPSPLSYEGVIVKIRWCVRVRLFFEGGRDFVSEHVFELGHVPVVSKVAS